MSRGDVIVFPIEPGRARRRNRLTFEDFNQTTVTRVERVLVCTMCRRLLDRCLDDPCYRKIVNGTARPVYPELPEPDRERGDG